MPTELPQGEGPRELPQRTTCATIAIAFVFPAPKIRIKNACIVEMFSEKSKKIAREVFEGQVPLSAGVLTPGRDAYPEPGFLER